MDPPVGLLDQPVEDRVGVGLNADHGVPAVDRDLRGQQLGPAVLADS
jgi:hypothetical protein